MRKNLSVYLDLLRLCAAAAVMLSHARAFVLPRGLPEAMTSYGSEAVAVFFALSGFVIRFTTTERGETDWRRYASARVARIYPVVILALAVTLAADAIGAAADPTAYVGKSWHNADTDLVSLARALSFTNEAWYGHAIFGSDEPFWSLGFEVPYYVLFGLLLFAPRRWQVPAILAWAVLMGPKILLYLPLWLLGAATYDFHRRVRIPPAAGAVGFVVALAAFPLLKHYLLGDREFATFHSFSAGYMIDGATYYLAVAIAGALSLVCFDAVARDRPLWSPGGARAIGWLAGGSFTLYLVHLPIMAAIRAFVPDVCDRPATGATAIVATCVVAYALAEVAERRKRVFRCATDALFGVDRAPAAPRITPPIHPVAPPTSLL